MHGATMYSSRYQSGYGRNGLGSRETTLLERSSRALPSKHSFSNDSGYSNKKSSGFSSYGVEYRSGNLYSGRSGRSSGVTNDIVRPSTRSRSTAREGVSKREPLERRIRDLSLGRTEYPTLSSNPTFSSNSRPTVVEDVRLSSTYRPEFKTIRSQPPQRKKSSPTYDQNGRKVSSSSLTNGTSTLSNGYASSYKSPQAIRTIHKSPTNRSLLSTEYSTTKYSPSHPGSKISDSYNTDEATGSSSSSSSSRRASRGSENISSSNSHSNGISSINAGKVGLRNIGNTCFMNSILQCLSNTKPLRDYCLQKRYEKEINRTSSPMKGKLVEAFSNILEQLWRPSSSSGAAVSTSSFKSQIERFSKRFSGYEQQDSQEFLRFLIEGLHEDVNRVKHKHKDQMPNYDTLGEESKAKRTWDFYQSKDDSYIVDLFMGQLKSSLKCKECGHVSTTFDPFWDLSLPIPKGYHSSKLDLQSCLETFTGEETLAGNERPTCEKCKVRRTMTKKFTLHRFPKILVIHLKRFNEGSRFRQKLSHDVEFPRKLQISQPISTSSATFDLYAVSNHSGSCYGGHYTAYCKNPETNEWFGYNDSMVSSMSSSTVQSKEAYVLFYEMSSQSRSHL